MRRARVSAVAVCALPWKSCWKQSVAESWTRVRIAMPRRPFRTSVILLSLAALACEGRAPSGAGGGGSPPIDLAGYELVDLSHAFDSNTLYWPTSPTRFAI